MKRPRAPDDVRATPVVHRLHLPSAPPIVGVQLCPKLMMMHVAQDAHRAEWMREGRSPDEPWVRVGGDIAYTPTDSDVGRKLRLTVTPLNVDGVDTGLPSAVRTTAPVVFEFGPRAPRQLVCAPRPPGAQPVIARVVTYNIMSQSTASPEYHRHCPAWALRWALRWRTLKRQLTEELTADVLCLQEVDAAAYDAELEPAMRAAGYAGMLACRRTRRGLAPHGCATFHRRARFTLAERRAVPLADVLDAAEGDALGAAVVEEARARGSIVLLTALRLANAEGQHTARGLCVANSHLHWDPRVPGLKALQAELLCRALHAFRAEVSAADGAPRTAWPVVIGADLNSTPQREEGGGSGGATPSAAGLCPESGVYELMRSRTLDPSHPHHPAHFVPVTALRAAAAREDAPAANAAPPQPPLRPRALSHALRLESAYRQVLGREPVHTNYTPDFKGTLDYVLVEQGVRARAVLDLPDESELAAHGALPSCVHPSDHLPLEAHLALASSDDDTEQHSHMGQP